MGGQSFGAVTSPTAAAAASTSATVLSRAAWAVKADTYSTITDALTDLSGAGNNARLGSSVGADAADLIRLGTDATNGRYIYMPGTSGNYLSVPDSTAISLTGDQTWVIDLSMAAWSSGTQMTLASKYTSAGSQKSWRIDMSSLGVPQLILSKDGVTTSGGANGATVTASTGITGRFTADTMGELVITWRASDGRVQFFTATSMDGTQTQLGTDQTANIGSIFDSTASINVSGSSSGTSLPATMKLYRLRQWSDITQTTLVLDVHPSDPSVVEPYASFTDASPSAATVTVNRSTSGLKTAVADRAMVLAGASLYAASANASALNFTATSNFTEVVAVRFQGSPAASQVLLAKKIDLTTGVGYALYLDSSGQVNGIISDGTHTSTVTSAALTSGVAAVAALVRDHTNTRITLWVNGTSSSPVTDTTTGTLTNTEELRLARLSGAGTSYFDGAVFAAALYTSALSAADLATLETELLAGASSTSVPKLGTYLSATTSVLQSSVQGESAQRLVLAADGTVSLGDDNGGLHRFLYASRHIGGLTAFGAERTALGLDAGLAATLYKGTFIGYAAGKSVVGGQACTLIGTHAGEFTQSNETTAVGANCLANVTTGNFNHGFGAHVLESLVSGHRNTGVGDEAASYLVSGSDSCTLGFYAGSIYNGGTSGSTTHSPTTANRFVAIGTYTGYNGDAATSEANDWICLGYRSHIGQGANYAIAIGSQVLAGAAGAVAIGVDHAGTSATTSTQDDFVLGTALHAVKVPGSLTVTGNSAITGNLTVTGVGQLQFARATSDTTRTSTAALFNHAELVLPVVASATYSFDAAIIYGGATTGDIQIAFTIPSGTIGWVGIGSQPGGSTQTSVTTNATAVNVSGTAVTYGAVGAGTLMSVRIRGTIVVSSTPGNLQLQWAQGTSDGTATTLYTNSSLSMTRVA